MPSLLLLQESSEFADPLTSRRAGGRRRRRRKSEEEATSQRGRGGLRGEWRVAEVFTTVLISAEHPGAILSMKTWPDGRMSRSMPRPAPSCAIDFFE